MISIVLLLTGMVILAGLLWIKSKKPRIVSDFLFQAKTQKVSFHYPLGWTLKITNDVGYVFGPKDSWTRMWFSLNGGALKACETTTGSIEIITSQLVSLPGINQQLRYIEAILPADTNPNKYIVYFGLAPNEQPFDQTQTYTGCLNEVKAPIFPIDGGNKTIIEFHSQMYANQYDAFSYNSKEEAQAYFQGKAYAQAKQIILSAAFNEAA